MYSAYSSSIANFIVRIGKKSYLSFSFHWKTPFSLLIEEPLPDSPSIFRVLYLPLYSFILARLITVWFDEALDLILEFISMLIISFVLLLTLSLNTGCIYWSLVILRMKYLWFIGLLCSEGFCISMDLLKVVSVFTSCLVGI